MIIKEERSKYYLNAYRSIGPMSSENGKIMNLKAKDLKSAKEEGKEIIENRQNTEDELEREEIYPGLGEGDDITLCSEGTELYYYTGDWESIS